MKENLIRALLSGIGVAIGITLVMLIKGEEFSIVTTGLYGLVTFIVDYIFLLFLIRKKDKLQFENEVLVYEKF